MREGSVATTKRKRKSSAEPQIGGGPQGPGQRGGGEGRAPQGPSKGHGGDPVRIYEDYVRRHLGGGEPAAPETYERDYDRAAEQFNKLPGAVSVPSTRRRSSLPVPAEDDGPKPPGDAPGKSRK